jgi:hypothetical protein
MALFPALMQKTPERKAKMSLEIREKAESDITRIKRKTGLPLPLMLV